MDSSSMRFAAATGWRALLIAAFGVAALEAALRQQYASAAVALALVVVAGIDLARHAGRTDRLLSQFIGSVTAGDMEWPAEPLPGLKRLKGAFGQAHAALTEARARQHREAEQLRALVDTAAAALFLVDDADLVAANRAARRLSAEADLSARLQALAPGERCVVALTGGQRALVTVARFSTGTETRLIAVQAIESELDAAEIKGWQDLARILAHEMMNSLTPVASLAESLKPLVAGGSQEITDAIEVIGSRSQHLMRFVERYRAAAELPVPVVAHVTVKNVFASVETLLRSDLAGVHLTTQVFPADLALVCDRSLIEQALINLLRNAADAVAGHPDATIALTAHGDEEMVTLAVTDTGPGIASDLLDRVFVPFFTTKPGGSGIGLSLARQISVAHGGRAEARSDSDGTRISLRLPALRF